MGLPFEKRVFSASTPTSTGLATFTASGITDVPVAAKIIALRTTAADTIEDNVAWSWGVTDGTNEYCSAVSSQHSQSVSNSKQIGMDDAVLHILNAGTGVALFEASFDSFVAGGVRLNFTSVAATARNMVVVLYFGDDCDAQVFYVPGMVTSQSTEISLGFAATFIETCSVPDLDDTVRDDIGLIVGVATNESGLPQGAQLFSDEDGQSTTDTDSALITGSLGFWFDPGTATVGHFVFLTDMGATSITFEPSGGAVINPSPRLIGLAVRPSNAEVQLDLGKTTGTSAPATDTVSTGWLPGSMLAIGGRNTAVNSQAGGGILCVGDSDLGSLDSESTAIHSQTNLATSDTSVLQGSDLLAFYSANGGVQLVAASPDLRTSTTARLAYSIAPATARLFHLLTVQEPPYSANGDVDGLLPQVVAEGLHSDNSGAGAVTGLLPQASGQSQQVFSGASAVAGLLPQVAGTGQQVFSTAVAITALLPQAAGEASQSFSSTGAATALLPQAAGAAQEIFTAAGTATTPLPQLSALGQQSYSGTGTITTLLPESAGAGQLVFTSTGVSQIPLPQLAGQAQIVLSGAGAITLLLPQAAGAAQEIFSSTGAAQTPLPQLAGQAQLVLSGAGAVTLLLPQAAGAAQEIFTSTGAVTALLPQAAGEAEAVAGNDIDGAGAVTLLLPQPAALGQQIFSGAGAVPSLLPQVLGAGLFLTNITAAGTITLLLPQPSGISVVVGLPFFGIGEDSEFAYLGPCGGTYKTLGPRGGTFVMLGPSGGAFAVLGPKGGTLQYLPNWTVTAALLDDAYGSITLAGTLDDCKRLLQNICVVRGDTRSLQFSLVDEDGDAVDLTGATAKLVVDTSNAPDDQTNNLFEIVGVIAAPTSGVIVFTPSTVNAKQDPDTYFYDVQITLAGGAVVTVATGTWTVEPDIADANLP